MTVNELIALLVGVDRDLPVFFCDVYPVDEGPDIYHRVDSLEIRGTADGVNLCVLAQDHDDKD